MEDVPSPELSYTLRQAWSNCLPDVPFPSPDVHRFLVTQTCWQADRLKKPSGVLLTMPGNASDSSLVQGGLSRCTKCLRYNMPCSHSVKQEKRVEHGEEHFFHPVGKGAVQHVHGWLAPQAGNITPDSWLNLCWQGVAKPATSGLSCLAD